jgi:nucleotide-binding universal stress UspA family protein
MSNMLVAVDGSKHSVKVVKAAIEQCARFRVAPMLHLTFVHLPVPVVGGFIKTTPRGALDKYYREEGEDALRESARLLVRAKLGYKSHIMVGPIAATLASQAKKLKCDMIVAGTQGVGSVSGMLLGSVAAKLVHLAVVPVLLIRV